MVTWNIKKIILAGNITRPSLQDINFDFETINLAKKILLSQKGDNDLLISITKLFQDKGFEYLDWKIYCSELFSNEKNLTIIKPSKEDLTSEEITMLVMPVMLND